MPLVTANNPQQTREREANDAHRASQVRTRWRARAIPIALLFVLSVGFRMPALINAKGVHSDAAIVGLQAMHMLRGEWSPLLFGSGYQTSVDSAIAALFFLPAGPSPLLLMLSTLAGHLLLTWFAYATLRRSLGPWGALVASLPLVFAPPSVHTYVLHPPRQAALTIAMASFWALDGAARRNGRVGFALGGALASLACFADPYAMIFLPGVGLFAVLTLIDPSVTSMRARVHRASVMAAGAMAGLVPLFLLWGYPGAKHGAVGLTEAVIEHNWILMRDTCLPWGLSTQAWTEANGHWQPWTAPLPIHAIQILGALVLTSGIAFGAIAIGLRRIPWATRRLGITGALTCIVTLAGFLTSVMVMDHFSTRYLAAIVLMAPFAIAPIVSRLHTRRGLLFLSPYLVSAAINGWLGFAPWTDGIRIVATNDGTAKDEERLFEELQARGVGAAIADYWVSYRLTLLWSERIVVVPKNLVEDRYAPYLTTLGRAKKVAYVFDPDRSREAAGTAKDQLEARGIPAETLEWLHVGRLTAAVALRPE